MADLVALVAKKKFEDQIPQCDYDTDPCLHTNESEKKPE